MLIQLQINPTHHNIPMNFFYNLFARVAEVEHIEDEKKNYWQIVFFDKSVDDIISLINQNILQDKNIFETFGKNVFNIQCIESMKDFNSKLIHLKLNEIKYNLGTIEYIKNEEKN